jgi:hypothetical protein
LFWAAKPRSHRKGRRRDESQGLSSFKTGWGSIKIWFPTADDLPLAHVPEDVLPQIRKRLDPWLAEVTHMGGNTQSVGVKGGDCYRVAQALVLTAKDTDVKYVEGLWGHGSGHHFEKRW